MGREQCPGCRIDKGYGWRHGGQIKFLATLIGIIPGTIVYSQVGAGLGSIFDSGESFTISGILTTDIILALAGLALLSLAPILYKKLRSKQRQSS